VCVCVANSKTVFLTIYELSIVSSRSTKGQIFWIAKHFHFLMYSENEFKF